jgi:hypothetical protein
MTFLDISVIPMINRSHNESLSDHFAREREDTWLCSKTRRTKTVSPLRVGSAGYGAALIAPARFVLAELSHGSPAVFVKARSVYE